MAEDTAITANEAMFEHRDMLLASLLEDHYRTRAAEALNSQGATRYTRQSPEVQPAAAHMFAQASQMLTSTGLLSARSVSDAARSTRQQYLSGLENIAVGRSPPAAAAAAAGSVPGSAMRDLGAQAPQLSLVHDPPLDPLLSLPRALPSAGPAVRSYYQGLFREIALLGKGGFGRVYQCYHRLDRAMYAVKKIPLSPKLGRRLCDGRHDEVRHILREVQALALLDHPNIREEQVMDWTLYLAMTPHQEIPRTLRIATKMTTMTTLTRVVAMRFSLWFSLRFSLRLSPV
ncbi:hypothetical protein P8C59_002909 [Phyllachora maydis]|uniref:Protein kinase domain-containing protein n=1 Tax=Phyllachora maydis TaxID=1825666 RepID=A0AAD9I0D1_9PEZI|nr:hypothetical protein P8C59_002909 [Phyllachora maydis]